MYESLMIRKPADLKLVKSTEATHFYLRVEKKSLHLVKQVLSNNLPIVAHEIVSKKGGYSETYACGLPPSGMEAYEIDSGAGPKYLAFKEATYVQLYRWLTGVAKNPPKGVLEWQGMEKGWRELER
ncbi:MAG: hypothetical protein V4674_00350 [Patescibacteria group bacterium]